MNSRAKDFICNTRFATIRNWHAYSEDTCAEACAYFYARMQLLCMKSSRSTYLGCLAHLATNLETGATGITTLYYLARRIMSENPMCRTAPQPCWVWPLAQSETLNLSSLVPSIPIWLLLAPLLSPSTNH